MHDLAPVITIDGPSGSGKGTVGLQIAKRLKWHFLDSGMLYRILALSAHSNGISLTNEDGLTELALHLDVYFEIFSADECHVLVNGKVLEHSIRSEHCGNDASKIAIFPRVRQALLTRQRAFQCLPGLVADGRDMGTIVFPNAFFKIFLDANAKERAKRRFHQLKGQIDNVSLSTLTEEIAERDKRDRERPMSPLCAAKDAWVIDTSDLTVENVLTKVMNELKERLETIGRVQSIL